jgi:type I restriction enzyme S subunit
VTTSSREVELGEVCEFKYGKSLAASNRDGGSFAVYGSNGVVGCHSVALTNGPAIIIGRKGSFGEVAYSEDPCWPIDTTYYVDRTATKADLKWLAYRLRALGLTGLNRAAAIPGLNRTDAYRQRLLLPPVAEQRRIAAILDKADALRAKRREAIAKLQSVFLDMFGDPVTNPKGWPSCDFAKAVDFITGYPFKSAEFLAPGTGVKLCRGTNVLPASLDWSDEADWSVSEAKNLARFKIKAGDVVVAMDRPWISSGFKIVLIADGDPECLLVQRVARLRPKSYFLPNFLYTLLASDAFKRHCKPTETTIPHISPNDFRSFPIFDPGRAAIAKFESVAEAARFQVQRMSSWSNSADNFFKSLQRLAFSGNI